MWQPHPKVKPDCNTTQMRPLLLTVRSGGIVLGVETLDVQKSKTPILDLRLGLAPTAHPTILSRMVSVCGINLACGPGCCVRSYPLPGTAFLRRNWRQSFATQSDVTRDGPRATCWVGTSTANGQNGLYGWLTSVDRNNCSGTCTLPHRNGSTLHAPKWFQKLLLPRDGCCTVATN